MGRLVVAMAPVETTYCAFEVSVSLATGTPAKNVPVTLVNMRKEALLEVASDENGLARLCDAPLEIVDVVVGTDVCGAVRVQRLKYSWPETQKINVIYVDRPCDHMGVWPERLAVLRVKDKNGNVIPGATYQDKQSGSRGTIVADSLGRIFRILKARTKLEGVVSKDGFLPSPVLLLVDDDQELAVILSRSR